MELDQVKEKTTAMKDEMSILKSQITKLDKEDGMQEKFIKLLWLRERTKTSNLRKSRIYMWKPVNFIMLKIFTKVKGLCIEAISQVQEGGYDDPSTWKY